MTSEDKNRCLGKCHSGALRKMDQGDASHLDTVHSPRAASFAPSTGGPPGRKHRGTPAKQASGAHCPGQEELLSGRGSPRFLSSGGARVKDTRVPAPRSEWPDLQASPPHAELNADPLNPGSQPAPSTPRRPAAGKPATAAPTLCSPVGCRPRAPPPPLPGGRRAVSAPRVRPRAPRRRAPPKTPRSAWAARVGSEPSAVLPHQLPTPPFPWD